MKTITWKVAVTNDNKIAILENGVNLPQDSVESQLIIIGILEDLKQNHLKKLDTLFQQTVRKGDDS